MKVALIGGGAFVIGKILNPLLSKLLDESSTQKGDMAFRAVDKQDSFSVYDESGEEVLQIDKGE